MPFLNVLKSSAKILLFLDICKSKSDFFIILIGNLAQIRSVIWRNYVRQFGIIPFGKMAHFCLGTWRISVWEFGAFLSQK
jgi:hypothetical protein